MKRKLLSGFICAVLSVAMVVPAFGDDIITIEGDSGESVQEQVGTITEIECEEESDGSFDSKTAGIYDADNNYLGDFDSCGIANSDFESDYVKETAADAANGSIQSVGAYNAIAKKIFEKYPSARTLILPEGITRIGNYALSYLQDRSGFAPDAGANFSDFVERKAPYDNIIYASYIDKVFIPDSVASIGDYAFYQTRLSEVNINSTSNLESIGEKCFSNNGATPNGAAARDGAYNFIKSITIPKKVREIKQGAFGLSIYLEEVIWETTELAQIPQNCFAYDYNLKKVEIPATVTSIGNMAYIYCASSNKTDALVIPDSVKTIGDAAFVSAGCYPVIKGGAGITAIGSKAFNVTNTNLNTVLDTNNSILRGYDWATDHRTVSMGGYPFDVKIPGVIKSGDNPREEWFTFEYSDRGYLVLKAGPGEGASSNLKSGWKVELFKAPDKENPIKTISAVKNEEKKIDYLALADGTYYVRVSFQDALRGFEQPLDEPFYVEIDNVVDEKWEKEDNDSAETANVIDVNKSYLGTSNRNGDMDYYKFTMPTAGYFSVQLGISDLVDADKALEGWDLMIYSDEKGTEIKKIESIKSETSSRKFGVKAGDYYVAVYGGKIRGWEVPIDIPYKLTVSATETDNWEQESNDEIGNANEILTNKTYCASTYYSWDTDYYKAKISRASAISIKFGVDEETKAGVNGGWQIVVYDKDQKELITKSGVKESLDIDNIDVPAGYVYVRVSSPNQLGAYTAHDCYYNITVVDPNEEIIIGEEPSFKKAKLYINKGDVVKCGFNSQGLPVKYSSSKKNIATISSKGKITAKAVGSTTITATVDGVKYKCKVYVYDPKISGKSEVKKNKTITLTVKNGRGTTKWKSSNKKIATVSSKGKVKGIKKGTVTIYATNNGKTVKKKIRVK